MATKKPMTKDANRDPLSGAPGAHPVGAGVGAAIGGAAAGAAAGAVGGPAGAAIGAVVGGVAGGYAGKATAEAIDPTAEEAYWEENYSTRPYFDKNVPFDEFAPAYRHGWESRSRYADRPYEDVATELQRDWEDSEYGGHLDWDRAQPAIRDAWDRVDARSPRKTPK